MPISDSMRPKNLEEFVGQDHLVGNSGPVRKLIENKEIVSMIFWGPPGCGKTTLARIISNEIKAEFIEISAVMQGKEELRKIVKKAEESSKLGKKTVLFIDEIHRWNKAQQDALLPYVESGKIILIGATTENPSFSIISPLLSRAKVFVLNQLKEDEIKQGLDRIIKVLKININNDAIDLLVDFANGDLRYVLNNLELARRLNPNIIKKVDIENAAQKYLRYDKHGDEHFNIISAVHKSLRSSNPTAAVYWIERMLQAGEDPLFIARRLIRFASEDIGNANPNALLLAVTVFQACKNIGMPECDVNLIQLAEYLAKSPKNNSAYIASQKAKEDIKKYGNLEVPLHLRNAPTKLMKDINYGKGYEYDHNLENNRSDQQCMPDKLKSVNYY